MQGAKLGRGIVWLELLPASCTTSGRRTRLRMAGEVEGMRLAPSLCLLLPILYVAGIVNCTGMLASRLARPLARLPAETDVEIDGGWDSKG